MAQLITYGSRLEQAQGLANIIAGELQTALSNKSGASLCVPGGTTPDLFLENLSLHDELDWPKIYISPSDERWVPETHERSNFALLKRTMGRNASASANFTSLYEESDAPEDVMAHLEEKCAPLFDLDCCILGMGGDMHTASLFPKAPGLIEAFETSTDQHFSVLRPADQPDIRLSLSPSALKSATSRHILICGPSKLDAVKQAEATSSVLDAPVKLILDCPNSFIHYAD